MMKFASFSENSDNLRFLLFLSFLQSFGKKFLEDDVKPYYKSDPIPENVNFSTI